jgi:plastocyanin
MKKSYARGLLALIIVVVVALLAVAAIPNAALAETRTDTSPHVSVQAWYGCTHVMRYGESLYSVAARYGVSYYSMAYTNGIYNPNFVYAGMVLRVPCPYSQPPVSYRPPSYPPSKYPPSYSNVCAYHIVYLGEYLKLIAARYGTSWQAIAVLNRIYNPNLIYVGMRLAIPCPHGQNYQPGYPPPSSGYPPPMTTPAPGSGAIMVLMQNIAYHPATVTIHMGQTVIWQNMEGDSIMHSATQGTCNAATCTPTSGGFDTGIFGPGQNKPITFSSTGTFHYYCRVHLSAMQGDVVVTP